MATIDEAVKGTLRTGKFNKNAARRVRHAGRIPAVVYGAGQEPAAIEVEPKNILRILHSASGHNSIFDLNIGETGTKAMIVDWQFEPIRDTLLHVDFKRIAMDKVMRVKVPISLTGVPLGVRTQGGILDQVLREVEIECLPGDIPSNITLDVTELVFGVSKRVSDLPHEGKLKFITDEDSVVAHVTTVKEEAAPADAAATPAEPEVAKKGKTDAPAADAAAGKDAKAKK